MLLQNSFFLDKYHLNTNYTLNRIVSQVKIILRSNEKIEEAFIMKKNYKRLLSIILCCSMLLGLLPFAAMAENANTADITGGV